MSPASVVNRKTIRKFIAACLQTHLGSKVQAVYAYQVGTFNKQSPVVCVVSGDSDRITTQQQLITTESNLTFDVHVFVRYQDSTSTPAYTEEQSEDLIDDIEQAIANFVLLYGENSEGEGKYGANLLPWLGLSIVGPTRVDQALMDNIDYRQETITLSADVPNLS